MVGTSLVVQWLRFWASNVGDAGLIPGWGIKIPHAMWCSQKKKIIKIINFTSYVFYHNLITCVYIYIPLKEKRKREQNKECIIVFIILKHAFDLNSV